MIEIELALQTVSETNAHEHWRDRSKRANLQRRFAAFSLRAQPRVPPAPPCTVRLTRIAPRALDSDNAVGALKHVRDGVADWLGIDDRDPRVTWLYGQERGKPKTYAVRVEVMP